MAATVNAPAVTTPVPSPQRRVRATFTAAADVTPWILVNRSCTVVVAPTGGTMKAQYTVSDPAVVNADNANATSNALAVDWPAGLVAVNTVAFATDLTAVRFVSGTATSGTGEIGT